MQEKAEIFEQVHRDYLDRLKAVDLESVAGRIGADHMGGTLTIPFWGKPYQVSPRGVFDPEGEQPVHSASVILCQYVLLAPDDEPTASDWVAYRDFRDAAPFVGGFLNTAERPIAERFSGRVPDLDRACRSLGGRPLENGPAYHLGMRVPALPRVPLFLLFNDRDDEFPAECRILFERRAEQYLDMECLAMLGMTMAALMKGRDMI